LFGCRLPAVSSGRLTAVLNGEVVLGTSERTLVAKAVRETAQARGVFEPRNLIWFASDLADLRVAMLEAAKIYLTSPVLIYAGFPAATATLESSTRHLGLSSGIDILILGVRSPKYQYLLFSSRCPRFL